MKIRYEEDGGIGFREIMCGVVGIMRIIRY